MLCSLLVMLLSLMKNDSIWCLRDEGSRLGFASWVGWVGNLGDFYR
jgi:hypothetical protein